MSETHPDHDRQPGGRARQQKLITDVGSVLVLLGIAFVLFGGGILVPALILAALFAMKIGWDLAAWRRRKRR